MSGLYMSKVRRKGANTAVAKPVRVAGYDERRVGVAAIMLFINLDGLTNVLVREFRIREALEPFGVSDRATVTRVKDLSVEFSHDGETFKRRFCWLMKSAMCLANMGLSRVMA